MDISTFLIIAAVAMALAILSGHEKAVKVTTGVFLVSLVVYAAMAIARCAA